MKKRVKRWLPLTFTAGCGGITGAASESELERIAVEVRDQVRPAASGPSLAENVLMEQDALPEHGLPVRTVSDTSIPPG